MIDVEENKYIFCIGLLLAAVGALAFVFLFSGTDFQIKAFQFKVDMVFKDWGKTEIFIPPFGKIRAATHKTPLKLVITLQNIDLEVLKNMLKDPITKQEVINLFVNEIYKGIKSIFYQSLFFAALGGAFTMVFLRSKNIYVYLRGAVIGIFTAAFLLLSTYCTYNPRSFLTPEYQGILKAAPWMIGMAEEALVKVDILEKQMEIIASNFYDMFEKIDEIEPLNSEDSSSIRILHISDIHNNPAAYQFIKKVISNFDVSFIIDTGDITDFGTSLETALVEEVEKLELPYIFVAGNHDSPEVIKTMSSLKNVIVLNGGGSVVKGIPIVGVADPSSKSSYMINSNDVQFESEIKKLKEFLKKEKFKPVIIAAHNPAVVEEFIGYAPVLLCGHNHSFSIDSEGGSVIINAGTSGAAGIRNLQTSRDIPYTVVLLHFEKDENESWVLRAADLLTINNINGVFTMTRKIINR
ncbi:MAG: Metallophosphoesterase [Clostridia bacterium 41_269]|nr:MAG: Metallophosphoesterase [Clostridia bacterium 41_269]